MAIQLQAVRYSENLTQYYLNELIPLADQVFRFAYGLTLSDTGAQKITEWAYIEVTSDLEGTLKRKDGLLSLLKECWEKHSQMKSKPWPADADAIAKTLSSLSLKARATLTAVDILGIPMEAFAAKFGWDAEVKQHLTVARKHMLKSKS